jgi:hypothetical protein
MKNCQIITIKYFKRARFVFIHYIEKFPTKQVQKATTCIGKMTKLTTLIPWKSYV